MNVTYNYIIFLTSKVDMVLLNSLLNLVSWEVILVCRTSSANSVVGTRCYREVTQTLTHSHTCHDEFKYRAIRRFSLHRNWNIHLHVYEWEMHQTLCKPSAYEMKRNQIQGTRVAECNEPQHNSDTSVTLAAINSVARTTESIVGWLWMTNWEG